MHTDNIYNIAKNFKIDDKFVAIFTDFYSDMYNMRIIQGGCHFISSVLHIILNELGYENVLRLGVAEVLQTQFSHSWVEFKGKVFDIAISNTNNIALNINGIIFADIDIETMKKGNVRYYNMSNKSPDTTGELVRNMTIGKYFDGCPLGKNVF